MLARAKTIERFPNNILLLQLDVLVPDTTSAVVWSEIVGYGTHDVGSPEKKVNNGNKNDNVNQKLFYCRPYRLIAVSNNATTNRY